MAQIGEGVGSAVIKNTNVDCWFCTESPKGKNLKNSEIADPDTSNYETETSVPENDEKNKSSALGKNLGNRPNWTLFCPDKNLPTEIVPGAHHCIPGKAAFGEVLKMGLKNYIREGGKFGLSSDIGYSINHSNNGVWLPGNYGVRGGKGHYKKTWSAYGKSFQQEYSKRAIKATNRQFHDTHSDYNEQAHTTLEDIMNKLGELKQTCPICNDPHDKTRPPYGLVGRLDWASSLYRRVLQDLSIKASRKWHHIRNGCRTSDRVITFFEPKK